MTDLVKNLTAIRELLTRWPDAWQEYEFYDAASDRHSLASAIATVTKSSMWVYSPEALAILKQIGMTESRFRSGEAVLPIWAGSPRRRIAHITQSIDNAILAAVAAAPKKRMPT